MIAKLHNTGISNQGSGIRHFTDLDVWQMARKLTGFIYKITKSYPDEEKFGLVSQMRRAAISVTSNIAEGFDRIQANDKKHFYIMGRSSCTELESQLIISTDLKHITKEEEEEEEEEEKEGRMYCKHVQQGITGLIRSMQKRTSPHPSPSFPDPSYS